MRSTTSASGVAKSQVVGSVLGKLPPEPTPLTPLLAVCPLEPSFGSAVWLLARQPSARTQRITGTPLGTVRGGEGREERSCLGSIARSPGQGLRTAARTRLSDELSRRVS